MLVELTVSVYEEHTEHCVRLLSSCQRRNAGCSLSWDMGQVERTMLCLWSLAHCCQTNEGLIDEGFWKLKNILISSELLRQHNHNISGPGLPFSHSLYFVKGPVWNLRNSLGVVLWQQSLSPYCTAGTQACTAQHWWCLSRCAGCQFHGHQRTPIRDAGFELSADTKPDGPSPL